MDIKSSKVDLPKADHVENLDAKLDVEVVEAIATDTKVSGTVQLSVGKIVYIPSPTADPQDPLNMSRWQKSMVIIVISLFSTVGLSLVSGFGGVLGFYIEEYSAKGKTYAELSSLLTYPTLTMGLGNLIGMPLAIAVGRRSVLLVSSAIMLVFAALCAVADTFEFHLAARMVFGLAAGQSESLVPMITQEIFFLHERASYLAIQNAVQTIAVAVLVLFASPIAGAITPSWWYGLGSCLSGFLLVVGFLFVPETKYDRPASSYQESSDSGEQEGSQDADASKSFNLVTEKPELDLVNFQPRTWRSDMRLWVGKPEWRRGLNTLIESFSFLFFPNVLWALCLNGLTLGINVAISTTYANIVTSPPYNWPQSSASYVNCGNIVTSLVALPVFGSGSDKIIKWFAKRRNGVHEPETRIIPLIIPIIVGVFTCVLYGQGATHPERYHWFLYVWTAGAYFFTFLGANFTAITYLLDAYPQRASSMLIIICAFRGIISFGVSYGIQPFIEQSGYDGAFGIFAGLTGAFGLMAIPIYIWGRKIRQFTGRYSANK